MVCTGCCSFPHGGSTAWLPLFAGIAYALAVNASYGCFFVTVRVPSDGSWDAIPGLTPEDIVGFGMFSYESSLGSTTSSTSAGSGYACIAWGSAANKILDGTWQIARACGVIGNMFLLIGMVTSVIMMCMSISNNVLKTVSALLLIASAAEMLTFVVFISELCESADCQFAPGAGLTVGASILAFIAGVFMYRVRPTYDSHYQGSGSPRNFIGGVMMGEKTVTVETTVEPDGTKTTVTTTTHPDGSKTIEETVERPIANAY